MNNINVVSVFLMDRKSDFEGIPEIMYDWSTYQKELRDLCVSGSNFMSIMILDQPGISVSPKVIQLDALTTPFHES